MTLEDKWRKCVGAFDYPDQQFASSVMPLSCVACVTQTIRSCARSGEEDPYMMGQDRFAPLEASSLSPRTKQESRV